MKGYRTIVVNVMAFISVLVAVNTGIPIPAEVQGGIVAGVMSAINIFMRCITDTPVGWDDPKGPYDHKTNRPYGYVK